MRLKLISAAAIGALAIAACAPTQTAYAPLGQGGVGYEDLRIEDNRWRVSFTGAADAQTGGAERLALRRAAELTLENGYDWFEVVDRQSHATGRGSSPVRVGGGVSQGFGSGGFRSSGVGLGIGFSPGQQQRSTVTMEIFARSGPIPQGQSNAYDARSILSNVI